MRLPTTCATTCATRCGIGVYEIYFLDKSPHAAVDQCVELVRTFEPRACGLANAVLRKAVALKEEFPFGDPQRDLEAFARQHAFPAWLAKRLIADVGHDAAREFMEASNEPAPLFVAVNAARAADEEVRAELEAAHGDPRAGGAGRAAPSRLLPRFQRARAAGRAHQAPARPGEALRFRRGVAGGGAPRAARKPAAVASGGGRRARHEDAASAKRRVARVGPSRSPAT